LPPREGTSKRWGKRGRGGAGEVDRSPARDVQHLAAEVTQYSAESDNGIVWGGVSNQGVNWASKLEMVGPRGKTGSKGGRCTGPVKAQ